MGKERRLNGQQVVLLANEDFSLYAVRQKIIQHCELLNIWPLHSVPES